jgi:phosphatidate cytidylyltransferase
MKTRIITALVATLIFLPFLIFSETIAFPCIMAFAAVMGVVEMHKCIGEKSLTVLLPSCLVAALLPVCARLYANEQAFFNFAHKILVVYVFYLAVVAVFSKGKKDISAMAMIYVTVCFIVNGFSSIVLLRDYPYGQYIYLLVFICPWMTDIFAYFTGYFLGKHKLIPAVSPKKTVGGAIGGIVFCVIGMIVFGFVIERFFNPNGIIHANYLVLAISGVFISVVSQIGDLIMSLVKRQYGIKDYGKLFPGHGGILDRFDSVLAVSLILAFICTYFDLLPITK